MYGMYDVFVIFDCYWTENWLTRLLQVFFPFSFGQLEFEFVVGVYIWFDDLTFWGITFKEYGLWVRSILKVLLTLYIKNLLPLSTAARKYDCARCIWGLICKIIRWASYSPDGFLLYIHIALHISSIILMVCYFIELLWSPPDTSQGVHTSQRVHLCSINM